MYCNYTEGKIEEQEEQKIEEVEPTKQSNNTNPFYDHPTKSLCSLVGSLGTSRLVLFKMRLEDGRNDPDPLFQSWKVLKKGWEDMVVLRRRHLQPVGDGWY